MKLKRDLGTEIENLDTGRVKVTACHRPLRVGVVERAQSTLSGFHFITSFYHLSF